MEHARLAECGNCGRYSGINGHYNAIFTCIYGPARSPLSRGNLDFQGRTWIWPYDIQSSGDQDWGGAFQARDFQLEVQGL